MEAGNALGAFLQTPAPVLDESSGQMGARILYSTGLGFGTLLGRAQFSPVPALDRNRSPSNSLLEFLILSNVPAPYILSANDLGDFSGILWSNLHFFGQIPTPIKIKLALPPPPSKTPRPPPPPKRKNFMGMGGFPAGRTQKCQAPIKLAQPFAAPELRAEILWSIRHHAFSEPPVWGPTIP